MFQRKRDPMAEASAYLDSRAVEMWATVPKAYPDDGAPFPAGDAFAALVDLAKRAIGVGDVDMSAFCLRVMATLAVAGQAPVPAGFFDDLLEARQRFLRAGHPAEERVLSRAGLLVKEYAERSGQGFVDSSGNHY